MPFIARIFIPLVGSACAINLRVTGTLIEKRWSPASRAALCVALS